MSRVAVITGSGRDRIGRCIANDLAALGFDLAIHFHNSREDAMQAVASLQEHGSQAIAVQADVANDADVEAMFQEVEARFSRVDVLVNTASVWTKASLEDVTAEDFRRSFDVNILGTFLCAREAGRIMVRQETGGCIINLGDWAIARPYVDHLAYFAAKGAIPTLTRALAIELGTRNPKVRVNCLHPGPVLFPPHLSDEERSALTKSTLTRTANQPESICLAVRMLIENPMMTGVCFPVDGGRSIYAPGSDAYGAG